VCDCIALVACVCNRTGRLRTAQFLDHLREEKISIKVSRIAVWNSNQLLMSVFGQNLKANVYTDTISTSPDLSVGQILEVTDCFALPTRDRGTFASVVSCDRLLCPA
jgi:hypothetical protein